MKLADVLILAGIALAALSVGLWVLLFALGHART